MPKKKEKSKKTNCGIQKLPRKPGILEREFLKGLMALPPASAPVLYVSGPMTGRPDHGRKAFTEAATRLRDFGYTVLNPAENDGGSTHKGWAFYMALDIVSVANSDALVVLEDWEQSKGATLEVAIAQALGKRIATYEDFIANELETGSAFHCMADFEIKPRTGWFATTKPENIGEEALRIVHGDRNASYGHPYQDYLRTAALQSAVLGQNVTAKQACLNMIAVKLSREAFKHKRDNLVDIVGYALCAKMIEEAMAKEQYNCYATMTGCMGIK